MRSLLAKPVLTPQILSFPSARGKQGSYVLARILAGLSPIRINYQAIVDLRRGMVAGYEATPRFPAALGNSIKACFEEAKLLGKDVQLEEMVIRKSLEGKGALPPNCFLSINVSLPFLISKRFEEILSSLSNLSAIVIEVAMDEPVADCSVVRQAVDKVKALDGYIALDHVGTTYSTLQNILEIRPNFIKLDRELTAQCDSDQAKSILIEMIGQAANRLDAWMISEGVETRQELSELIYLKLPLGQGRHLGRPHLSMEPLAEEKAAEIRSQVRTRDSSNRLTPHVEVCPMQPTLEAAQLVLANSGARLVAIADTWGRPIQLLECHPLVGNRVLQEFMKAQISSDPAELLLRALARPAADRFDPIVVINNRGLLQGVVHMDQLARRVVDANLSNA